MKKETFNVKYYDIYLHFKKYNIISAKKKSK